MKTILELTATEKDVLIRIVAAKLETKNDLLAHGNAHATEVHDPDHMPLFRVWEKLTDA